MGPRRLLIVDDDDLIAAGLPEYLELHGRCSDTARDFENAKSLVRGGTYSVALVDLLLTGMALDDGLAFLQWLRRTSPGTTVVVLTAYRTAQLEQCARSLGVTSFLDKPKRFEEITQLLRVHS